MTWCFMCSAADEKCRATGVCKRCGAPICDDHSTEGEECYDPSNMQPLHVREDLLALDHELAVSEWIDGGTP